MLGSLAAAVKGFSVDKDKMDPFDFLNYMPPGYSGGANKNNNIPSNNFPKDVEEAPKETSSMWSQDEHVVT